MRPSVSIATQSEVDGHETEVMLKCPKSLDSFHAPVPPVGLVELAITLSVAALTPNAMHSDGERHVSAVR